MMVFIKIFLFNAYFQAPFALMVTTIVIMMYAFARPFESTELDRLQMCLLVCELFTIVIGILFNTVEGAGPHQGANEACFFILFVTAMLLFCRASIQDLVRYRAWNKMASIAVEHNIKGLKPKAFSVNVMTPWLISIHEKQDKQNLELLIRVIDAIKSELRIFVPRY